MQYNFNEVIDRRHTDSIKWDHIPENPNAIPMWIADMDFRCPQPVIDAVSAKAAMGVYAYTQVPPAFSEAIVTWQRKRNGWDMAGAQIIPVISIVPAIYSAVAAFTQPGDQVIIQRPVYGPFTHATQDQGREVLNNPLRLMDGRYELDLADLEEKAASPRAKLMFLCNPHNPTGRVFGREELLQIGDICRRHGVTLFADEIHSDFLYPGMHHIPAASLIPECIMAVAPSKSFNLASMKAAAVITKNDDLARRFRQVLAVNHNGDLSLMGIYALIAAYNNCDDYIDQLRAHLWENVAYLRSRLQQEMPRIRLNEPEGTYLMWLDCRAMGMTQQELNHFFTWQAEVAVNSGDWFGPEGAGFVRMNLACPHATLEEALNRISRAYQQLALD